MMWLKGKPGVTTEGAVMWSLGVSVEPFFVLQEPRIDLQRAVIGLDLLYAWPAG